MGERTKRKEEVKRRDAEFAERRRKEGVAT
jgi:hypothetical protein